METKDVVIPICTILGGAYRDEIKAIVNTQLKSFWTARQKDFEIVRERDNPGVDKFQLPDPLFRETVIMLAIVVLCGSVSYWVEHVTTKGQGVQSLVWLVNAVEAVAFIRFMVVQAILVGYRATLLGVRLPRLSA